REAGARMKFVFRGMRPSVHPDLHLRTIFPGTERPGDHFSLGRFNFLPDVVAKWSLKLIGNGPPLTLSFDHSELGRVIAQRLRTALTVKWQAGVLHAQDAADKDFVVSGSPCAGKVDLAKSRAAGWCPQNNCGDA